MRTTLTIDDDLLRELKETARARGIPFKDAVNEALAVGLRTLAAPRPKRRYRTKTFSMGVPNGVNLDKALQLAADLEDAEIVRKMELRK